jgi:hypothetical protein
LTEIEAAVFEAIQKQEQAMGRLSKPAPLSISQLSRACSDRGVRRRRAT